MSKAKLLFISILFTIAATVAAQNDCSSIGWANLDGQSYVGPITGGGDATPIEVTTFADLKAAAESSGAKVIYVMNDMGNGYTGTSGDVLYVESDKTIIGYSPGITVKCSWQIRNENIIIKNLICRGPGNSNSEQNWDCVNISGPAKRIWFDHCTIMEGEDGNFDVVKGADNVTATWCKFTYVTESSHNLSNLVGSSDNETQSHGKLNITYAYCWWEDVSSRCPRTRYGKIHVLNSYYHDVGNAIYAGKMSNVRVEGCVFENVNNPTGLISTGGEAGVFVIDCIGGSTLTDGMSEPFVPNYEYKKVSTDSIKQMITDADCGAGPTLDSPTDCGCIATIENYTLTTSVNGQGSVDPSGGIYVKGKSVLLTATAADGWQFDSWSGDYNGTANRFLITMNADKSVTANFTEIPSSQSSLTSGTQVVKLYPVPVDNVLNISFSQKLTESVHVQIFDAAGKLVKADIISDQFYSLDVSGMSEGMYVIKMWNKDINIIKQVTK